MVPASAPRLRLSGCVLSMLVLVAALLPGFGSSATAAPGAAGNPDAGNAGARLAARAAAAQQRLLVGTRRLAATQLQLRSALVGVRQAERAQRAARQALARATDGVNSFAAAAYREPGISQLALLLELSERDPQDALAAAGYLDRAGDYQAEVLDGVRAAESRAATARAAALHARRQAIETQRRVLKQVAHLQAAASAAAASLSGAGTASRSVRRPLPATDLASVAAAGYPNGLIPGGALCHGIEKHVLRCDAAAGFRGLAAAYAQAFGRPICVTDSYRSYPEQVAVYRERPSLAAVPGSSNHGWGLAADLCGGLQSAGTQQDKWMHANASRFGWAHPAWAEPGGSRPEPWHWEFIGGGAQSSLTPDIRVSD